MAETWLKCSACRTEIGFGAQHWICSVSTCNRSRTRLVFCSVVCWDSHVATLRHRDAWAVEARAPTKAQWEAELAELGDAAPVAKSSAPSAPIAKSSAPSAASAQAAPIAKSPTPPPKPPAASSGVPRPAPTSDSTQPRGLPPSDPVTPTSSEPRRPPPTSDSTQPTPASLRGPAPTPTPASADATSRHVVPPPPPAPSGTRRVVGEASPASAAAVEGLQLNEVTDRDILIVVSKMKKYIKERSGMNCSDAVAEMLSDHVRVLCDDCIRAAARDERKTVLDRDVPRPRR
jgi:histone H3/H4